MRRLFRLRPIRVTLNKSFFTHAQNGFSLIEIIITLVFAAIVGGFIFQFMGTSVLNSIKPLAMVQEGLALDQVMENITSDYKRLVVEDSDPLSTLRTRVLNNSGNYGTYSAGSGDVVFVSLPAGSNTFADSGGTETDYLRVTITNGDHSLSALFVQ